MAIYYFKMQVISRGGGRSGHRSSRSVIAAAAYRSGEKLMDEQTGEVKFYGRKVQPETMILAPENAPKWVYDRQQLWNEVERSEKRINSRLAREVLFALPKELNNEQQKELVESYVRDQYVALGMIADIAIHRDDENNPHAHILLTTREITPNGFGAKNRDWNKKEALEKWREEWANYANRALEKANVKERISHLSNEARGLEYLPQVHMGHKAHALEKKGIRTEVGDINRMIKKHNEVVTQIEEYKRLKAEREATQKEWAHFSPMEKAAVKAAAKLLKTRVDLTIVEARLQSIDRWEKKLDKETRLLAETDQKFVEGSKLLEIIERLQSRLHHSSSWKRLISARERELQRMDQATLEARLKEFYQLGFNNRNDFEEKRQLHEQEKEKGLLSIAAQRSKIQEQRDILEKARTAFRNALVREVAKLYPDWPEAKHLSYDTAIIIKQMNERAGRVIQPEQIRVELDRRYQQIKANEEKIQKLQTINIHADELQRLAKVNDDLRAGVNTLESLIAGFEEAKRRQLQEEEYEEELKLKRKKKTRTIER
ncbi:MobQ family relaxase [Anoxybacillus rupiensis]|uniref:MobQ family relaxase n=1 Tax=Anoxybacteroides rupiense TaxID=311460 RepID=A0ABD5IX52_9BACL|nr:MobQ family relaxase [Anoxybacillus rupiensis]